MAKDTSHYISFITDELKKGNVDWSGNVGLFMGKFGVTEETFRKYWGKANEAYKKEREAIEKQKAEEYKQSELEAVKTQIYTKSKFILELENDIANISELIRKGYILKEFVIDGKKERKKEIFGVSEIEKLHRIKDSKLELLKKVQGYDAPKQVEQKNTIEDLVIKGIIIEK